MLIPACLNQATYNLPARVHRPRCECRAASIVGSRVFLVPLEQVFVTYGTDLLNSGGVFLKEVALKVCALCGGSGVVHKMSEYPDPPNQRWCQNCDEGRAKSDRIIAMVRHTLAKSSLAAA
jgi:hypothetical protein